MKIIINADDFGMRPGIDNAIVELVELGLITSVSVLVKHTNSNFAFKYLNKNRKLGAGIHIDLDKYFYNAGFGTNPDGVFLVPEMFFDNEIVLNKMKDEIRLQFDIFTEKYQTPDHVNGHHNVHLFLPILKLIIKEMKKRNIKAIRFIKDFYITPAKCVEALDLLNENGIFFTDKFIKGPILPKSNGALNAEIMVHISENVPEEECYRVKERNILIAEEFKLKLNNGSYETVSYSEIT